MPAWLNRQNGMEYESVRNSTPSIVNNEKSEKQAKSAIRDTASRGAD